MNWYRAKTILIVFFLIMNIFLLSNIIYSANKASFVTPEIINSTIEVLAKNDITIDYATIPSKKTNIYYEEADNIIADNDDFAEKILGNYTKIDNGMFYGDTGTLTIDGDFFRFTAYSPLYSDELSDINESNSSEKAINIMKRYGFDINKIYTKAETIDNAYIVTIIKKLNDKPLFSSQIRVSLSKDGLQGFDGTWFNETKTKLLKNKISLKNITGVLVDFILNQDRPKTPVSITQINLGYYAGESSVYHKSVVLIPVWEITLNDGSHYYLDARESR
ncbi:MAG: two-component system regulatory protein YycI [Clostridia bacterium]|nr:two-component system regulatory protein YycI [Clostridia bacterium]